MTVGSVSGSGTSGPAAADVRSRLSGWWKEAVRLKIVRPCWTAVTRRVVNDRPSRTRSTWYTIGTPGAARPQEVRVQRVHRAVAVRGPPGGDQRLARDLPAEDPLQRLVGAAARGRC